MNQSEQHLVFLRFFFFLFVPGADQFVREFEELHEIRGLKEHGMQTLDHLLLQRSEQFFLCFKVTRTFAVTFDGIKHAVADGEEVLNTAAAYKFA